MCLETGFGEEQTLGAATLTCDQIVERAVGAVRAILEVNCQPSGESLDHLTIQIAERLLTDVVDHWTPRKMSGEIDRLRRDIGRDAFMKFRKMELKAASGS